MLSTGKQFGVSLVELMVAVVVIGILFMLAAPSFNGWVQNQKLRTGAESILNGIQLTRNDSVKNNSRARFVLCGLPSTSWEVLSASAAAPAPVASLACAGGSNAAAGDVRVQERSSQDGSRLAFLVVTPVGANAITFNNFGRVVANADGTASITSIAVSAPGATRALTITVGIAGNTRMCDPSPLLAATDPRHC